MIGISIIKLDILKNSAPPTSIFKHGSISGCCGWFNTWSSWIPPSSSMETSGSWQENPPCGSLQAYDFGQVLQRSEKWWSLGLHFELNLVQEHGVSFSLDHACPNPRQTPSCLCCGCARGKGCHHRLSLNMDKQKACVSQLFCPPGSHRISKQQESQGGLIYSWCFSLSLSLLPRSHSRRGTEEFLPLSPSQFQMHLQPFIATDHGSQVKAAFVSQLHLVL